MLDLLEQPPTCCERIRHGWSVAQTHPGPTLLWLATFVMLVWSTISDTADGARWAIWLALLALLVSIHRLARFVVRRVAHITALWHEDVQPRHRHRDSHGHVTALPAPRRAHDDGDAGWRTGP